MAASEEVLQGVTRADMSLTFGGRALRFFGRVLLGLLVAYVVTALFGLQGRLIRDERTLDFPLWVALDDLGVSVLETEVRAIATVETADRPPMSRLKALAEKAAGVRAREAELWSDIGASYRAVYFEGADPEGGTWLVSGNYIERVDGSGGRVDLSVGRSIYGRLADVRNELYGMRRQLERAAAKPLAPTFRMRVSGRPESNASAEALARELLRRLDVGAVTLSQAGGEVVAFGYSPRLPGRADWEGSEVNVVVRVTERGLGPWIEIGTPTL